jgi:hypothetical protein
VEEKTKGAPEKMILVLDAFKRHVTPQIKAPIISNSMITDLVVIPRG